MKCGICGKDTFLGFHGEQIKIYNVDTLNRHKKADHPKEFLAARVTRRAKAETTRQAQEAEAQRVSAARLAASRPVVIRSLGQGEPIICPSSKLARWQLNWHGGDPGAEVRFPDAQAYREYERIMVQIAGLNATATAVLIAAWERGTPVTLEHLDELDRAAIAVIP